MRLKGKKAIITGANKNIGAAIALKFAQEGAEIVLHYNNDEKGATDTKNKITKLGGKASILQADFSTSSQLSKFINQCIELLGGVDILVNNAASYDTTNFLDLSQKKFDSILTIGAISPFQMIQQVAKNMIENNTGGSIINISAVSGLRPYPNRAAHATTKAALNMITQTEAIDLGEYNIRVNAICPGAVPYDSGEKYITNDTPLQRTGRPDDIANAAIFLASEESSWITGLLMLVDGGYSLSTR